MKTFLINLLIVIATIFAPIQNIIISVFVLILCDLVFGVMAARKRKEKITSAGIRRTVSKFFVYEIALCICFIAETYLLGGVLPVSKILAGIIGIAELKSILESLDEINGSSLLAEVIKKLGSKNDQP